jgi:3-phosphoshikimate 1-carboxyvinyltransferase
MEIKLNSVNKIEGEIEIPADKSITHRAVMLSSIACGSSVVKNYLLSDDCKRTIAAFEKMGAEIKIKEKILFIKGCGLNLQKPKAEKYEIYAGNSGTTARLISGILAGQKFTTLLSGDESLSKRPMRRVIEPLSLMGTQITSSNDLLPMEISGRNPLKAIHYESKKPTAQVKSAVLFAGLYADGKTSYCEPVKSRDHSERMLKAFGANVKVNENTVSIYPVEKLNAQEIIVPSDISSAAFFIAAVLIVPGSKIIIKNVCVNPTRDGIIEILQKMGADIKLENLKELSGEPVADIVVRYSKLKSVNIDETLVPRMVDEIPIFALIAAHADGITKISGAKELRVKESDRIESVVSQLKKMGVEIESLEDGFLINGKNNFKLKGAVTESFNDHRIAMTLAVASLIAQGETTIRNSECVDISFPNFYNVLKNICR